MTRPITHIVVFLAGLAVVGWISAGYAGTNALALAVTLLIGGFYLAGAFELKRYRQATSSLAQAIAGLSESPASLAGWIEPLHPSLRNAVRLRVEGERTALPGPALTPYLVGLLVLLGMFGTFLGMVATLRGTGIALEGAADLDAIRASLAAPVKGLGFAFGTSVAGVATSAMLGLLSALCRRERIETAQALDARIATTLRPFSRTHQREEAFRLLQRQADVMPTLVDRLQAMMTTMEQQHQAMSDRLAASQAVFHDRTDAAYGRLADAVQQSLTQSIADSTRTASAAIQPAVEATMAGIARETAALHTTVTDAVKLQLDGLSTRFEGTTATVADLWQQALAGHQRTTEAQASDLRATLDGFAQTFDQRSAGLVESVATRLDATAGSAAEAWNDALARQASLGEKMAGDNRQAVANAAAAFEQQAASLVQAVARTHADLKQQLSAQDAQRLQAWTDTLGAVAATLRSDLEQASARAASHQQETAAALAQTARDISAEARTHAGSTIAEIDRLVQAAEHAPKAAVALQEELASRDQQRLTAWTEALAGMAAVLRAQMEQANAAAAGHQQQITETLAQTARDMSAEARTHASTTIAEIDRLVQAAELAPKAAVALQEELASRDQQRFTAWTEALAALAATLRAQMEQAGTNAAEQQQQITETLAQTARDMSAEARTHASTTIAEIERLVQAAELAPKAAVALQEELASRDQQRLTAWTEALAAMAAALRAQMEQANASAAGHQQQITETLAQTARDMSAEARTHASTTIAEIDRLVQAAELAPKAAVALQEELASRDQQRFTAWTEALTGMAATLRAQMEQAGEQSSDRHQAITEALAQTARDISTEARTHASSTIAEIDRLVQAAELAPKAAVALQAEIAAREEQRMAAWTETLGAMASSLRQEWEQTTAQTVSRQQDICDTLAQTTRDISAQTQAQASHTITEVSRLVQAATEAPKAAAEVIAELRQKLTDSMARDNAMLEERGRLLETLGTLLDAVNHASTEQRLAVDSLVTTTAGLLDRVGTRFHEQVESETGKLATVAAQVTGSAVEVASLGEALGVAVQVFSESNDKLMAHLERIETALDKSMTRSDEQLAYYVAQAREVVDLSMRSQKQVLEDLQQLAGQQASNAEAA
ncbi:DUF802 domain-containing protein [Cupriavidus numazuensis]|uniref:DUF802 domain-containing protein n=1 Tax=Cupriavidus numazuensis TaxID=221992 RepID=A0ABM8TAN0_9BURK|nr:DUF802 domain-containing protein [Cupriavidus numazuensis]CAG2131645.1 hypothetical protein LMG26411_00436 [Cupriavidus numazuensis]